MPNRRGRKPLATMPLDKKHAQKLTNQRKFRQRKENYIRDLEIKSSNLEMFYNSAQTEIKNLNDRIEILEKRLASVRNEAINNKDPNTYYGEIVDLAMYQAKMDNLTIENEGRSCGVIMNDDQILKDSELFCDPITTSDEPSWVASTSTTTSSSLYPTFVARNPPQNTRDNGPTFLPPQDVELQWIQSYITTTTHHHPLNLKWILSDAPNEE
ncbi:hypothetical protein RclHR1_00610007 [Rhizophagus clarus]|uniref:Fungal AP-1-like factor n=1 Tax=Rhizophagus clarus TaxID=94130 RepID=A0A2Z6S2V7_9GLOM|nr:hypothetical protein RclHR1_00610007 [Rhizophagus clarus]GES75962.1 fungal AP-1-like factor [Rhizophagus clarus]